MHVPTEPHGTRPGASWNEAEAPQAQKQGQQEDGTGELKEGTGRPGKSTGRGRGRCQRPGPKGAQTQSPHNNPQVVRILCLGNLGAGTRNVFGKCATLAAGLPWMTVQLAFSSWRGSTQEWAEWFG